MYSTWLFILLFNSFNFSDIRYMKITSASLPPFCLLLELLLCLPPKFTISSLIIIFLCICKCVYVHTYLYIAYWVYLAMLICTCVQGYWTTNVSAWPWRKLIFLLSIHWAPIDHPLEVKLCGISIVHVGMSTVVVILSGLFRQKYWKFLVAFPLLYPTPLAPRMFYPFFHDFPLALAVRVMLGLESPHSHLLVSCCHVVKFYNNLHVPVKSMFDKGWELHLSVGICIDT